ncbi:MAG: hypothetical protein VW462_06570, partial [Rhodospirillales bacterium]
FKIKQCEILNLPWTRDVLKKFFIDNLGMIAILQRRIIAFPVLIMITLMSVSRRAENFWSLRRDVF